MTGSNDSVPSPSVRPLLRPRPDVADMAGYYSPQLDVDVRLNTNEAPEPPPAGFVQALREELESVELNRYPDREATELRRAIGELHGVGPEEVYCANGSNEVLQSLLLAYGGPGRAALVFEPTYALHSHIAHVTGTRVLVGKRDAEFLVDPQEIANRLATAAAEYAGDPSIVFLCSPNNPTGRLESAASIAATLAGAPGLVVVDEAYGQFAPRSVLELRAENRHLVVVRTFSKTWSLAAMRLGYAIADPEVVEAMFRVTLPYHLDAVKQAAGRAALRYVADMEDRTRRLVSERERLLVAMATMPLELCPSDANFILFRPLERPSTEVWQELLDASVLVRDVSGYERLSGYLRTTVGSPRENDAFIAALGTSLEPTAAMPSA
jgi:histidinol-phosphate aminotransferase